jgi:hypothetical protein
MRRTQHWFFYQTPSKEKLSADWVDGLYKAGQSSQDAFRDYLFGAHAGAVASVDNIFSAVADQNKQYSELKRRLHYLVDNKNGDNSFWLPVKIRSNFLCNGKQHPFRLYGGKLDIHLTIASKEELYAQYDPTSDITGFVISDAILITEEITYPASYWDAQISYISQKGCLEIPFDTFSVRQDVMPSTGGTSVMTLTEKRLWLNYIIQLNMGKLQMPKFDRNNPTVFDRFRTYYRNGCMKYEIKLNGNSITDRPVSVYVDADTKTSIEPYLELSRVYRRMFKDTFKHTDGYPNVEPDSLLKDGFILCGLFSSYSGNETESEESLLDGLNNYSRTGQISIERYSNSTTNTSAQFIPASGTAPTADANMNVIADVMQSYIFLCYTAIFKIDSTGRGSVLS